MPDPIVPFSHRLDELEARVREVSPLVPRLGMVLGSGLGSLADEIEDALREFCSDHEWTAKQLFMPVRVAVTGRAATPPLFETMAVLGKEVCRRRLRNAMAVLRGMKVE